MVGLLGAAVGLAHCPQVVGFSSVPEPHAAVQTPAPMGAGLPTGHGYQAAVLRASTVRTRQGKHTAQSQSQVHMSLNNSDIRQQPEVSHEILLKATLPSSHETASLESAGDSRQPPAQFTGKPVQMVRTGAFRPRARSNSVSDVEPSRPTDGVMQWVVVSSWSDADGDRMVLATAISNGTPGRAAETRTQGFQQVHPYAAVPVRDGWLIFQL